MATEAEVPESVSATTEGEGGYLTAGKFDITVNQFSPVQLKKSEGEEDQHPERVKCFVEGETASVESKNGISECGNPLEPLSDSKVDKHEEDTLRKGEALDVGEASVAKEEDSEGFSAVEHSKTSSTDHEGENETDLFEQIQPVTHELARPKLNSEEDEAATSRESSKTTTAGDERQVVKQSCEEEGKVEEANTSYDTIEDETPGEQNLPVASILMRTVTESEIAEVGESTISEPNEIVERSEGVLNVSTVKGDEGDQGDGTNATKDDKDVDTFTAKAAEDDEYTSAVTIKETSAKVTPNDDESSPQTVQKCDSGEELQHSRDVLPEETKTETSRENAEEITCTKEETTIQHAQESLDEEKKEATENTRNLEDDNAREEVLETSSTKQETGEHLVGEIHTEPPQDFVDKETNEETSTEYQACVEAADLSTYTEEKNLEEQAIPELSSRLVVEETAKEIPKEEETAVLILKEEKKEEDTECNEPTEVASMTHETQSETTEDTTEPNKDLSAPISEESNKTFVENISTLAEVSKTETEKNIQEKNGLAVSNSDSASGEVSHVTGLKEAETEKEQQKENIDTAPEEKGQATILKDETVSEVEEIGAQAEENCESIERLEEHIPTAADKVEIFSKEAEAENEELINNNDVAAEEKVSETILTNERTFDVEDTNVQAEKNVKSNENLEENIPTAADEGETSLQEAEAESKDEIKSTDIAHAGTDGRGDEIDNSEESLDKQIPAGERETSLKAAEAEYKEQVKHADIVPEEKGLATILTDETPLNVEDIEVKTEDCVESKENVEEQILTTADESEKSTYISPEDIEVQEDENFITLENLENPILSTSGERESGLGEAEAEIKEQVKSIDIVPEEIATISTAETPLDVEDIGAQAEESLKSKENVEEQIPTAADDGEKFLKEAEAESKEQIGEEIWNSQESSDKGKQKVTEITNTQEDDTAREEVLETTSREQETGEHVAHEIHTVVEPPRDSIDKETNEENSTGYQACTEGADLSTTAEEKNLEEQPILELSSALVVEETAKEIAKEEETDVLILKEEEKEEDAKCNKPSEVTSITHETQSETTEDITEPNKDLSAPISEESNKTFVENISTLAEVSETETEKNIEEKDGLAVSNSDSVTGEVSHVTGLKEAETENEEQKESIDTAPEEKGQATILKDETASEVEEISVQGEENRESKEKLEEHIPTAANEGETFSKEAEAENEEQIHNSDVAAEEKVSETILTNEKSFDVEDTNVQAEKNAESNENLEENIPTADEGETSLQEAEEESKDEIKSTDIAHADTDGHGDEIDNSEESLDKQIPAGQRETSLEAVEAEYKEQVKHADIFPEEKSLATILTDETPLNVEDIEVKTEDCVESKENVEEQIPTTADEGEKSTYISPEDIEVQEDENFITQENLENPILTTSDEGEKGSGEAEAEIKEQLKTIDIVPEEIATISTAETPLDVEDIGVQAEESLKSKENVEEQIPTASDGGEKFLKEAEAENKEQIGKENLNSQESSDKGKQEVTEITNTLEDDTAREEVLETTSTEQETGEHVAHEIHTVVEPPRDSIDKETNEENSAGYQACTEAEIKEQVKSIDIVPEEIATISTAETPSDVEVISVQAEESLKSKEIGIDIVPEEIATISTAETPLDVEDIGVQAKESFKSKENVEEQIPTAADEGEKFLKEAEAENKEQIDEENLNSQESSDKGKQEVTETTNTLEDDTAREEVLETTSTEQETGDHVVHEIHTVVEPPRDSIDKETNEENSAGYQASTDAADLSTTAEEKNLEEHDIQELSSPLVVEEETNEIPKEEETYATLLEEEKKEGHATCNEPTEKYEAEIEKNIQEKDGNTVSNSESLSGELSHVTALHECETEIERQDKNIDTTAEENIDTAPEEKGQATILKGETASEVEDIGVQAEEKCESKENLEEHIPTAADKVETFPKEAKAENEEQINNSDVPAEEKVLQTILTNEKSFDVEDTNVQAEKNVESNENLEVNVPTAADEGETFPKEAEAESKDEIKNADIPHADIGGHGDEIDSSEENLDKQIPVGECETSLKAAEAEYKEQVIHADIAPEEKGLVTILTDETPLDVEDIEVKTEDCVESKENVEERITTTADEGEKSTYISQEDIEVQADENITTLENLENPIPTTSGERETGLREAEAEIKEQVKSIDIVPEEIATISTAETPSDVEDIGVQAEESLKSKENVEEQIPTAANEGENFLKETEAENKEQIDEETLNSQESSDKEKEEVTETTNTKDDTEREEVIETTSTEQETVEHVVHEIHTVPEPPRDSIDKETNEDNSAEYQECTEAADLSTSAEEKNLEEHAIRELSSSLVVEEATNEISKEEETYTMLLEEEEKEGHATCNEPNEEYEAEIEKNIQEKDDYTVSNSESLSGELSHVTALKESETEIERQDKNIDTAPEEKGKATISADETASEVEDIDVQLKENLESEENLEEQLSIAADEGEIISKEAEAEKQEQIKNVDIVHEDVDAQAEKTVNLEENIDKQIPPIAHEGETSLKETTVLILKEEEKEEDTECNEPAEVASMTHETQSETTEAITEPNKGFNAPISGESNKTFVENISTLAEVSETETEKNIEEKDGLAVSNSDSVTGEVSHVTGLKEAETENEEQKESIDTAPEEKGQATILKGETASEVEDIGVQKEENCESKENLEERIPAAADKVETFLKEAEAENEEQINNSDVAAEEKVLQTISTNEKSFDMEDTCVQAEKNVESNENLEENFPTTADEGETSLQEAEAESKDEIESTDIAHADTDGQGDEIENSEENLDKQIPAGERETSLKAAEAEYKEQGKHADIVPEEKGLATILTDETPLDVEDIEVKTEDYVESKENVGEQIPTTADEGEKSTYISPEDIEVQADENFITQENLENPIPTTSGERETGLGEAEAEIKEQVKSIDIVPEEIVTISTAETPSGVEDIGVQAEESLKLKEEEQIPTAADEGEKFFKEAEAEKKEQIDEETLNSQKSSDKEKEVTEITNTKDDTEREEVLETTSTEQETGEHVLHEIHTVPEPPQDSIDKETNEDNSAEYQACTEAADLSTSAEEKNLKEHAIQELSSPLVVEEATNEISKEEETYTTLLEEEEKEGHATCNEPNEEYEAEIEKNIQEKDDYTVSNSESLSGELSHVTALKESETEIERQDKNIDAAPEEKGQATISADETASEVEDIDVQLKENLELEENLEEQFPIAADEGEIILKEAEAENQEQIKNVDIAHEDVDAQAEKTVNSEENIDKQIPPIAHEGETSLKEAEAEDKEQVTYADIAPEEKGLATILIDETPLEAEDIGVEVEESFETKEKFEEQNPIAAGEDETLLKEAEAENKEQIKYSDIASEEKGLATILTDEKASNVEDIGLQAEETFNSSGNLESKIPSTADEHETSLKEAEAVSTEQVTYVDIVPEEKGLATILTDETPLEAEDVGVQAEESFEPKEKFEEKNPITADEDETLLKEAEAENKEQIKSSDISPQEKGLATISTDEATLEVEDIGVQAEKSFESKEDFEEKIPTVADEDETCLKEAEAETKEHIKCSDIAPEEKGLANILTDETSLDVKDIEVKADDSFESNENLEEQIPTAEGEGETCLREAKAESDEQVKNAPEENVLETISKDEMALDIDDACVQPQAEENSDTKEFSDEQNPTVADEGEEKVAHGNVVLNDTPGVQILEEAEPKVGVEEESCKSEDQPEKTNTIVEEILKESQADGVDESIISETTMIAERSEQIVTSPVKYEEGEQGESSSPVSKEEGSNEDTFSTKVAEEGDGDNGAVTVIETSADVHGEEGLPQAVQKYEPVEGHEKLLDLMPEESKTESSSKNAEVVTCTKEEIKIQNIQESLDEEKKEEETTPVNGTKENETEVEEVFEIASTEQETGEHATREIHTVEDNTQEFNDKETTEENLNEYQVSSEAADSSTDIVGKNSDEQASRELSSLLVGEDTSIESSKQEENYVSSLKEEENEVNVECKEPVEVANTAHETKFETLEDSIEPKKDLYAPTSEEETHTDLKGAEAETKEQVKDIEIDHEEKGLATILTDGAAMENVDSEEFSEDQIPTVADEGEYNTELAGDKAVEESFQVQSLEEAEPKLTVEDESHESKDYPENNNMIVEEPQLLEQVLDEPKSTDGDFGEAQTTAGNAAICTPDTIQEETAKNSQDTDKEGENLQEEILKEPEIAGVGESTACETNQIAETSEEIFDASPLKCEEGQLGEGSSEDTFSIKVAEDGDGNNGAVTVIETSADVNGEEGLPQAVQKYEPVEGHEKLLDLMPEESKTESSSKNAEVVTCTKEEIKIQNIQESLDEEKKEEETTPANDTKQNETEVEEVFGIASTEQETGEHATREIHTVEDNTQEFNDKETTEENLNEYQVSSEAADSSTDIVGKNSDEQASRELSSSLVGEDTSIKSSKQEENYVSSLKEKENEATVECKEPVKVAITAHETQFETLDDSIEPKEDLYAPTSEEATHTDLKGAEAETKEQVKDIEIDREEKGLATILTDGAALENVDSEEFSEDQIPTVADEGEYNTELAGDKAAQESFQVQSLEEAEPKLKVEDESRESRDYPENNNMILEEPQQPEQVLDEPKSTGRDFSEGQTTEGNAAICTPERIQEETATNSQDGDKETENLMEEGSSIESVKACNTDDPSQEFILEDGSKKFDDNKQDTVKFKGEILKETEIAGVGESTTSETNQIAESSEEISGASPVKYEEGQPGEGSSQDSAKASKDEDVTEDDDNNGAVTVTESSAEVTSKGEEESAQALEKSEPEEEKVPVKISDVADAKEVCDLEDKAPFAEKTTEETSLQMEGHSEVSELAPEKLDVEATEEEFKESSEIVPESDSRSIDVVSKDEIVTSQTLDEGISQEQVEIPSSTLLTEGKEIKASQHEHETPTKDKNIEEEHEKEMPADENARDLSAERSEDETPLQKEESKELKASELALEKQDAGDTEEGIKETLKTISKSDSQSTDAVLKDEIVADQTHLETSYALLPMEEELKTYQDDRETTTQDKSVEEEYAKETEVLADENGRDLVAATLAEETLLKEESRELKVSELAPENLDAGETKEEIKESFEKVSKSDSQSAEVVSADETTAYQTELAGDKGKAVEESFQVQSLEEAEPKLRVEDENRKSEDHPENNNMIVEEPQPLEQVLDEPKSTDGDSSEGQTTKRNAAICTPEIIEEGTAKNSQDSNKGTENSQEEILKEPEVAGVGESTTYEMNQIAETSEEIFDASPVKYEEGRPGEGSCQDSAKASKEEDVTEDDDNNGAVTVTESNAEVTSKGEEDSAQPLEKYEPEEEKVPVKVSDVADAKEVCNVEDKASFAEKTTEETSLQTEGHAEVSELAPEKLDVEATEEEFKEGSEIVCESDYRSIDVVLKDEIATSQTLEQGISQEQVEIPSSTLLTEAKEIEASQHEHETPAKDKNIGEEHEKEIPADENAGDLSAVKSEDETPLPKEQSEELKPSELALEKLDAGDTEEIKETLKTISESDSQSTDAVPKDEIVADQIHLEASSASLPKAEELKTYQDDRETTTQDKSVEEEYAKETEVPADENGRDLVAPTLAEETLLQKEEPEELKVSELAPENLDAGETEKEIKESFEKVSKSDSQSSEVVSGDETTAYQTLHGGISSEQLQLPSSTLVPEEKEIKISQREHETTTQDKNKEGGSTEKNEVPADENTRDLFVAATSEEEIYLQKEEPREFKACELAPEKVDAGETEEIKETLETISTSDSQSIDTVSKDDIVADQTLVGESYTSLPKEKEHEAGENEVPADENGGDLISARSIEETILQREDPGELKASEVAPEELNAGETEEEIKKTPERVSKPESPSTDVVSRDEAISDQILNEGISTEKLQIPSSVLLPEEKEIKALEEAKETSLIKEEPREPKASDFEPHLTPEVPTESSNEEIMEDEKLPEELEPASVREESHHENKAKAEKQEEQTEETSTIRTNEHQNELSEVDEKGIPSEKYERQLTFEDLSIKEHDPRLIEDKTIQEGFPEEEKRVEEADFEFGIKNQEEEKNSKSSMTEETQIQKDSKNSPIVETSQEVEAKDTKSSKDTCIAPEIKERIQVGTHLPEEKEATTTSKEQQIEEDEEEEHEHSEEVKTDEEKGENEHKNGEPGYDSPIMVEASRDAEVKVVSHKKSSYIFSGIKHSISKVKKAITCKSSHSKTRSEK